MSTESARSNSAADSYVGSLISLTSKSEIRYEGIFYNINTDESSIGLRNVRSFGTEGRKKDGPQVLPSEKVYEYILFRGSDIKDLQVKSTPPVQPPMQTTAINSDPAIIQSHYLHPSSTSSSLQPPVTGSLTDTHSHTAPPGSTYQGGMPLYQPGGNLGSWGPPPHPGANGSAPSMPMYWPGYYAPANGPPQPHQQSLLRPPSALAMPPSMQYPAFNPSLPTGTSSLPGSSQPEFPLPLLPTTTGPLSATNASLPSLPPVPPLALSSESLPSFMQNKAPNSAIPAASLGAGMQSASLFITSSPDGNTVVPPIPIKPVASSSPQFLTTSRPISSVVEISTSVQTETAPPSLVTPGQLLQSGKSVVSSAPLSQIAHKDVKVVQVSQRMLSELPVPVATEAQPPILPLPQQSRPVYKPNGAPLQARYNNYRGRERGRGSGISRPVMKFTEEFDFMAMNEKFNKDEVWGYLGKSNHSNSNEKEGDENATEEDYFEEDPESHKSGVKPVYSKDDFFDTLSCNSRENQLNNGRPRFSEQMKLDTETFGEYSRHHGGRGPRGGRYRGGYNGRGYGYAGRGRGRNVPHRDY
ncbi:Decapping 5 [Heracleum sosnowskyi]|uniref:Decapping 5 n=1 Tax=Heracleum sosnowskyi TaxID=360622 RepID=A0AAD8IMZ2_9APIA|nr:Decapping 5 [Heracleum sosnowskyi]